MAIKERNQPTVVYKNITQVLEICFHWIYQGALLKVKPISKLHRGHNGGVDNKNTTLYDEIIRLSFFLMAE